MLSGVSLESQTANALPDPSNSGIEHIVFVMMENRSFDHYLGWLQELTANRQVFPLWTKPVNLTPLIIFQTSRAADIPIRTIRLLEAALN